MSEAGASAALIAMWSSPVLIDECAIRTLELSTTSMPSVLAAVAGVKQVLGWVAATSGLGVVPAAQA